jgi:hypothetical protein
LLTSVSADLEGRKNNRTIEAADGTKTRVDFAQKNNGKVTLTEAKGSQTVFR